MPLLAKAILLLPLIGSAVQSDISAPATSAHSSSAIEPPHLLSSVGAKPGACGGLPVQTVKVTFKVTKDGLPSDIDVSKVPQEVRACATEAVQSARFSPAMQGGRPVAIKIVLDLKVGSAEHVPGDRQQ